MNVRRKTTADLQIQLGAHQFCINLVGRLVQKFDFAHLRIGVVNYDIENRQNF